jgi:6-phosphogluconolactonase
MKQFLHIYNNADAVALNAATFITEKIESTLKTQDRFTIALSGGSTPKKLHQILATEPFKSRIDWTKIHVFWGDERAVPFLDERNNAKMAYDTLLSHVPVPPNQVHIMNTDLDPRESALEYSSILLNYFGEKQPTFDLIILGMGDDGHTLSLFPYTEVVHENNLTCTAFFLKQQEMFRITLTKKAANLSSCVLFLTTGSSKANALFQVLKGEKNIDLYPSQTIQPINGELHWMVDNEAAALL